MVLQAILPGRTSLSQTTIKSLCRCLKVKYCPLEEFLKAPEAAYCLNVSFSEFLSLAEKSETIHMIMLIRSRSYGPELLVHPDGVIKAVRTKHKSLVTRTLKTPRLPTDQ